MKICPKCNAVYDDVNGFCQKCGVALINKAEEPAPAPIAEKRFCPNCGAPITTSTRFCPQCGKSTTGDQVNNVAPQMKKQAANVQTESQAKGIVAAFKCAMFEKYATARGRASRSEYWYSVLVNTAIILVLHFVFFVFGTGAAGSDNVEVLMTGTGFFVVVELLLMIVLTIPGTCLSIRRLHDTNHSGWWVFINIVPFLGAIWFFYLCAKDSEPADNIYGSYPPRYF